MLSQPLTPAQARHLLLNLLGGSGLVLFSTHAQMRMKERGVSEEMVMVVLEDGEVGPAYMEAESWRHRVALQETVVVVAIHHEDEAFVVTVFVE